VKGNVTAPIIGPSNAPLRAVNVSVTAPGAKGIISNVTVAKVDAG